MRISKETINNIVEKAQFAYSNRAIRQIVIQYSLAMQILIQSLGNDILEVLIDFFPEAKKKGVNLIEDSKILEKDGYAKIRHIYSGETKAPCIARIIYFAHSVFDLEQKNVENFNRAKEYCKKQNISKRPFEKTYYEIVIASSMARRNLNVRFIEEGKTKTPDLIVKDARQGLLIECKCNTFVNLNNEKDQLRRTKRMFDKFEEGCEQIQCFGEINNQNGFVYVQYIDNTHILEDREFIGFTLMDIASKYPKVIGGGFTYEIYNSKKIEIQLKFTGFIKPFFLSQFKNFYDAIMFQKPIKLPELENRLSTYFN